MGETTCLMQVQTFCYAPGHPIEASECNPLHALGQSISFGRFMSESLEWEKWSTFNSNSKRYVEEAERYSRPGSVAQKKAFFEAHYKKIAARKTAALLEQANHSVETEGPVDNNDTGAIQDTLKASSEGENQVLNSETEVVVKANVCKLSDLNIEGNAPKREVSESQSENKGCAGNPAEVEFQNQPEDNLNHLEKDEKQNSNDVPEELTSVTTEKPSAVPLDNKRTPSFNTLPAIPGAPISSTMNVDAAPASKKLTMTSSEKKRTTQKSLFMSVNFSPLRELNRLAATVMKKIKKARLCSSSSRNSEVCPTPLRTPITAFENESDKYKFVAPSNTSTHLSSKTEERTARRKKKLEEKFNAVEEKAKSGTCKLEQAFCFKARALPEFHVEIEESKYVIQIPVSKFEQFNEEDISTRSVTDRKISVPSHRPSNSNGSAKQFQAKNGQSYTTILNTTTAGCENS